MSKRLTTEEFIERSKLIHGDKYDYSFSEYINCETKIKIICPTHGVFDQIPYTHFSGGGCVLCGYKSQSNTKTKTTDDFIKESKNIHGNKYDYSFVEYISSQIKVKIVCYKHGIFYQAPDKHLCGQGCTKCGYDYMTSKSRCTKESFIDKAKKIHGNKYDYSLVDYKNNRYKIKIICKIHSEFNQAPHKHLNGQGCPKCGREAISIINKENPVGWSISNWENSAIKSKYFDSFKVYIIRCWNEEEEFYKIGRTFRRTKDRFGAKRRMPYNYEIINELIFDNAKDAYNKETELKKLNKKHKYIPKNSFFGQHECFDKINLHL